MNLTVTPGSSGGRGGGVDGRTQIVPALCVEELATMSTCMKQFMDACLSLSAK